jgi:hypothetical protein
VATEDTEELFGLAMECGELDAKISLLSVVDYSENIGDGCELLLKLAMAEVRLNVLLEGSDKRLVNLMNQVRKYQLASINQLHYEDLFLRFGEEFRDPYLQARRDLEVATEILEELAS